MRDWIIGDKEKTVEWRDSGYREDLLNLGSGRVWGLRCRPCQRWHGHGFLESRELLWCCGNGNLCSSGRVSHQRHSLMESDADVSCLAADHKRLERGEAAQRAGACQVSTWGPCPPKTSLQYPFLYWQSLPCTRMQKKKKEQKTFLI